MTVEQGRERDADLARVMTLLVHSSGCRDIECPPFNCAKMKGLLQHVVNCPLKVVGYCQLCRILEEERRKQEAQLERTLVD